MALYGHLRQVVSQRHVLRELFLRDPLLHLELAVFDAADVAVNDADMIFLADDLVALRMRERVLHLHAFERLDYSFDILAGLVARGLDRLLDFVFILSGVQRELLSFPTRRSSVGHSHRPGVW